MAALEKNLKKLQVLMERFNVKNHINVFSCIVIGRSWNAINQGIMDVKYSENEVNFHYNNGLFNDGL